jgi:oligosaccharide repeat unit polymerase
MLNINFLLVFSLTPIVIWFMLKLAGERINQVSVLNITSVSIYFFSVLGLFPLFYMLDKYRLESGINNPSQVFVVLLCSFTGLVFFLLGAMLLRKFFGFLPYPLISCKIQPLNRIGYVSLLLAYGLVMAVLALYLTKIEQIALFIALHDSSATAAIARSNMGNNFPNYHWYKLIMHDLGIIVSLSLFTLWLQKKSFFSFILFLSAFSIASFVAVMATEKLPLACLLIALFMTYYLVRNNGFIPKKSIVFFGAGLLSLLTVLQIYFMNSTNVVRAIYELFSRTFSGSISPAYFYLDYVPFVHDFYWFKTFPNPGNIFPYEAIQFTVEIMNWKFPEHQEQGIIGSMPTVFWGEAYLNFGFIGIPLVAFIMGCIVALVAYLVSKLQLNAVSIAFIVWIILHFMTLAITGFSGFLYDFYFIGISLIVLTILFVSTKLKFKTRNYS